MKCMVCSYDYGDTTVECPKCSFPAIGLVGSLPEAREVIRRQAEAYRRKRWPGAQVYLLVYTNAMEKGRGVTAHTDDLLLGNVKDLQEGGIVWSDEQFAQLSGSLRLDVKLEMQGAFHTVQVTVDRPDAQGFWQVGLMRERLNRYRIVVGDKTCHTQSTAFSLW